MLRGLPQLTLSPGQRLRTGRQRAPYALHSSSLQLLYVTWGPCAVGLVDNGVIRTTSRNFKRSFSRNKKRNYYLTVRKLNTFILPSSPLPPLLLGGGGGDGRRWRRAATGAAMGGGGATGGGGCGDGRRRRTAVAADLALTYISRNLFGYLAPQMKTGFWKFPWIFGV